MTVVITILWALAQQAPSPPPPPAPPPKVEEAKPKVEEAKPKVEEAKPKAKEPPPKVEEAKPKAVEAKPKAKEPPPNLNVALSIWASPTKVRSGSVGSHIGGVGPQSSSQNWKKIVRSIISTVPL